VLSALKKIKLNPMGVLPIKTTPKSSVYDIRNLLFFYHHNSVCLLYILVPRSDLRHLWGVFRFDAVASRRTPFWEIVNVTLSIQNVKDEVFSSYGENVVTGQSCRFWPFGAVENAVHFCRVVWGCPVG